MGTFGCSGHFLTFLGTQGTFEHFWALLGTFRLSGPSGHFWALWTLCALWALFGTFWHPGHDGHFLALSGIFEPSGSESEHFWAL